MSNYNKIHESASAQIKAQAMRYIKAESPIAYRLFDSAYGDLIHKITARHRPRGKAWRKVAANCGW